jgi:hypothetical protein
MLACLISSKGERRERGQRNCLAGTAVGKDVVAITPVLEGTLEGLVAGAAARVVEVALVKSALNLVGNSLSRRSEGQMRARAGGSIDAKNDGGTTAAVEHYTLLALVGLELRAAALKLSTAALPVVNHIGNARFCETGPSSYTTADVVALVNGSAFLSVGDGCGNGQAGTEEDSGEELHFGYCCCWWES